MACLTSFLLGLTGGLLTYPVGAYLGRFLPGVRPPSYGDLLPWEALMADGAVTRDGSLLGVYRIHGPDLMTADEDELGALRDLVSSMLVTLPGNARVGFELVHLRSERELSTRPADELPEILAQLEEARTERLRSGFRRAQYFTCALEPRSADLESHAHQWQRLLEELEAHLDGLRPERLTDHGLPNFLHRCALVPWQLQDGQDVPVPYEPAAEMEHLGDTLRVGEQHLSAVAVLSFPETLFHECVPMDLGVNARLVGTFHLPELEALKAELSSLNRRWSRQRFNMLDLALKRFAMAPEVRESLHVTKVAEAIAGHQAKIQAGERSLGKISATLFLWNDDLGVLEEETRHVLSTLRTRGFSVLRETWGLRERFLTSLPGARPAVEMLATTADVARVFPLTDVWTGSRPSGGPLDGASPLLLARRSATRSPFRFEFTNVFRGVGHTIVLGPTGAGKSTLLSFLSAQWLTRYPDSRAITIDYGRSAMGAVAQVGGSVYGVSGGQFAINLLRGIDDPESYNSALEWLSRIVSIALGKPTTPAQRETLVDALQALKGEPQERRRLRRFVDLLQDHDMSRGLADYCQGGPLGNMLDADASTPIEDDLWTLFEMEALLRLDDPWSIPVLDALLMKLGTVFAAKRPVILVMDEVWRLLQHPIFAETIKEYLLTLRKLNVSVILASQNTLDFEPTFLKSLVQQCSTRIFLADRSAIGATRGMYHDLGLTDHECETVAAARPRRDYYIASEAGKALIHLDLSRQELEFLTESP